MLLLFGGLGCSPPPPAAPVVLDVLAASSLTDVLPDVAEQWRATSGNGATLAFDATSRLAKQVEAGLPADVFFSADVAWIDWLDERGLVRSDTRRDLLGNTLVVVVPQDSSFVPVAVADLADARIPRLALAGESVPAGQYAQASLEALGAWDAVAPRAVRSDNVRTVLGWVASGEAAAGVVYATDARAAPGVRVALTLPADSHPPIVYPVVVTTRSDHPVEAEAFVAFCASPQARATFEAAGFGILP